MLHSHLRENLSVKSDIFLFHEGDKLGVGSPVGAEGIIETDDPERAETALFGTSVATGVLASLNHGFFGLGEKLFAAPTEAFGLL